MISEIKKIKETAILEEIKKIEETIDKLTSSRKRYSKIEEIVKKKQVNSEREKYNEEKSKLESELEQLKSNLEELAKHRYTLNELNNLCKQYNLPFVLTEEDLSLIPNTGNDISSIEDIYLVHKGGHPPVDNKILSTKNIPQSSYTETIQIGEDIIEVKLKNAGRSTIHFAVNHEVASHFEGNWDNKKYITIIPFKDIPKDTINSAASVDTSIKDKVELTPNTYILCPEEEIEEIKKSNPNCIVVGFRNKDPQNKSASRYADAILNLNGVLVQPADQHSFKDIETEHKYNEIMHSLSLSTSPDFASPLKIKDEYNICIQQIKAILDYYEHNISKAVYYNEGIEEYRVRKDIIDKIEEILVKISRDSRFSPEEMQQMLNDDLSKYGITFTEKEEIYALYLIKLPLLIANTLENKYENTPEYKEFKRKQDIEKFYQRSLSYFKNTINNLRDAAKEGKITDEVIARYLHRFKNHLETIEIPEDLTSNDLTNLINDKFSEYGISITPKPDESKKTILSEDLLTSLKIYLINELKLSKIEEKPQSKKH